jgi:nucleotide-binding universal stress UspA family protein
MSPFTHVLVPLDLGDAIEPAIDLALSVARPFDAQVTLLHAFDPTPFTNQIPFAPQIDLEPVVGSLERELAKVCERTRAKWPRVDALLRRGNVHDVILDVAKERRCDLIVLGTHGRRGLSRALLGSVAEKIVRLSPIPVLTVRPRAPEATIAGAA